MEWDCEQNAFNLMWCDLDIVYGEDAIAMSFQEKLEERLSLSRRP
jgi:hypothetical protein